ncbi:MAG: hypothetical protein IKZ00_05280, partial [Bacteroidaceae bacterium]|nr:hypothetical protein [Bacteroidaceae bacterium]
PFTMVFYPSDRSYTPFTVVFFSSDRSYGSFPQYFAHLVVLWRSAEGTSALKNLKQAWYFAHLFVLWRSAEGTSALKNLKQVWFFAHLVVLWRSAEGTSARKFSSKLGISLTYSYLCSRKQNVDRFGLLATTQKNAKKQVFVA